MFTACHNNAYTYYFNYAYYYGVVNSGWAE